MTHAATQFITPITMQALTGRPVYTDAWDSKIANNMPHIDLSRDADLILIAPASADLMAKIANGLADDLLSTLVLARKIPLLIAPAMNVEMWTAAATQRNAQTLQADGALLLGPAVGEQACGETGAGRMLEAAQLLQAVEGFFQPKVLAGQRVLITAGPTFEAIDPVRGITNLSSGKMGYALARAAHEAGAQVTLISGPTALDAPFGVLRTNVQSAQQMLEAVLAAVSTSSIFISVAAVSDWRVGNISPQKIKKQSGEQALMPLQLIENPDILATVAALPAAPFCVGFAAETEQLARNAQAKRSRKKIPLLIANDAVQTIGADTVSLVFFADDGQTKLPNLPKLAAARLSIQTIANGLKTARAQSELVHANR